MLKNLYHKTAGRWSESQFWTVMGVLAAASLAAYVFFVAPLSKSTKAESLQPAEVTVDFTVFNPSEETWKDVKMTVYGAEDIDATEPELLEFLFTDELGSKAVFNLGDIIPGFTKSVTLLVRSVKGDELTLEATFKDAEGRDIREPETRKVKFE